MTEYLKKKIKELSLYFRHNNGVKTMGRDTPCLRDTLIMYNEILLDNIHFGDRFPKKIQLFFFF